ncbi:hypothetical protein HDU96_010202 [Phlyctochytrium bullatum]|nr:hypothetical protein HDU96_010202 [Phlyctochytrium bullatum]
MENPKDPIQFFRSINQTLRENFSPARKRPRERTHLVQKFQRAWDSIIVDFQTESNWGRHVSETDIVKNLQNMVDILLKERAISDGGVEPGGCTELFLNEDIMAQLVKISENDVPIGFRGEVIRFLNNLVSVLDPNILIQNAIHRPTLTLLRLSMGDKEILYEDDLVELGYDIAQKIHEHKELLYIFFSRIHVPRNVPRESIVAGQAVVGKAAEDEAAVQQQQPKPSEHEFLLFDYLLRYVHLEGHRGDFAREGCLFLVELATGDLDDYIVSTDFASSVVAGLGGLYSQLPPTLPNGVTWGESIRGHGTTQGGRRGGLEAFKGDMEAFLHILRYIQGILLRSPSSKITKAVLLALKDTFLENIVQSSITNASDFDGTTVSVLFYIHQMLMAIREDELSSLFTAFLLSGDDEEEPADDGDADKRSESHGAPEDLRLGLRDILISKLSSLSEEVVAATLTVFQTLLSLHSHYSLHLLIERLPFPKSGYARPLKFLWGEMPSMNSKIRVELKDSIWTDIQDHLFLVSRYFALVPNEASFVPNAEDSVFATNVYPEEASLGAYLSEAEVFVKSHFVRHRRAQAAPPSIMSRGSSLPNQQPDAPEPRSFPGASAGTGADSGNIGGLLPAGSVIRSAMIDLARDTTLRKLLTKFANFFGHSFEINIALTGVISQLASAPVPLLYMYLFASDILLGPNFPSLHTIVVRLRREIEERRSTLPQFDAMLSKARADLFSQKSIAFGIGANAEIWPWRRKDAVQYNVSRAYGEVDLDAEFMKNVIVLEETIKELLSILVVHGSRDYDQIVYL